MEGRTILVRVSYRLFGGVVPRLPFLKAHRRIYRQSGISLFHDAYISLALLASTLVFVISCALSALLHRILLTLPLTRYILAVLSSSWTFGCATLTILLVYPMYRGGQRGKEVDANLVYTIGYMGVLAAGGIPVERIFERVAEVEHRRPIRELATRFIANIRLLGLDVLSSLRDLSLRSPSATLSKILLEAVNTVETSGDLRDLFLFEVGRLLEVKRDQLKRTLGTLNYLGEIYITAIVVSPILFILMLTMLSILGGSALGLPPVVQMNLLVFVVIPVMAAAFLIILDVILPEEG